MERRVAFIQGALGAVRLPVVDAYYFYNPFEENMLADNARIDGDVELSPQRYARDLEAARELLDAALPGTYVLTYNGLGGKMPRIVPVATKDAGNKHVR